MTMTRPAPVQPRMPAPRPPVTHGVATPDPEPARRLGPVGDAVTVLSMICLWLLVQTLVLGAVSENRAQNEAYTQLRGELAAATAPIGGVITPGEPVALLRFPSLGRELVVVEGTASGDLLGGPAHRRDTPLPGQQGVSLVYGRAHTYGAPFAGLTGLRPGDHVVARTGQGRAVFVVDRVRRAGDPVPQAPSNGARLTLVTAESTGPLSAISAASAVYIDATLAGTAFVAPAGRLSAVPDSERAMGNDPAALPLLVVGLGLVLLLVLVALVARQRWSATLVWLVAVPLVLAAAWSATDVAVRLLPNLL